MNAEEVDKIANEFASRDAGFRVRVQRAQTADDVRRIAYEWAENLRAWSRFNERHGL